MGLNRLEKKSNLSFCAHNSTYFSRTSDIVLDLESQNVGDRLTVKVFELNTTAYYHSKMAEIDETIDLDGLIPSETTLIELSESQRSPRVLSRHCLTFPSIRESTRGVFVIEVIAGGRSARAMVRVGRLRIVTTSFPAGQVVSVFDEQNNAVPPEAYPVALWPQYVPETHEEDQGDVDNAALFPRGTEILIPYATRTLLKEQYSLSTAKLAVQTGAFPRFAQSKERGKNFNWMVQCLLIARHLSWAMIWQL